MFCICKKDKPLPGLKCCIKCKYMQTKDGICFVAGCILPNDRGLWSCAHHAAKYTASPIHNYSEWAIKET